ncbi:VOC family protein [Streptomyces sp. NPDC089424]|uniref:VOC family protein n=1 Tax=Streptomyces sp. NPDC089424 TaxID=3365917 RepID=UPI0037F327C5
MELAHVRLLVSDFAACYRFYAEVLGLKPQSGAAEGPYEKFSPTTGAAGIVLQDRATMAGLLGEVNDTVSGHRSLVVLRVDDLDATCDRVISRGATLLHGPAATADRMRTAHLKDPEGNLVELQEWQLLNV